MRFSSIFLSALSLISYSVSALPASRSPTLPGSPSGSTPARVPSLLPLYSRSKVSKLSEGDFFEGITLPEYDRPGPYILLVVKKLPIKHQNSSSQTIAHVVMPCFPVDTPALYALPYLKPLGMYTTKDVGKLYGDFRVGVIAPGDFEEISLIDVKILPEKMQGFTDAVDVFLQSVAGRK